MQRTKPFLLPLLLAGLIMAFATSTPGPAWAGGNSLPLDTAKHPIPAVDFTAFTPSGDPVHLSDFKGQVVMLNFWATWCPPCKYEMPGMERLHRQMAGKPFTILAVNVGENAGRVQAFLKKYGYDFAVLLDPKGDVSGKYSAESLPMTYLIDKDGNVKYRAIGARDWDQQAVMRLLQGMIDAPSASSPFLSFRTGTGSAKHGTGK